MADAQERPAAAPRGLGQIPRDGAGPASSWRPRLVRAVAEAVDAVPGVVRRESSVADFVRSLRVAGRRGAAEAVAAEGVRVRASGSAADVTVWISVDGSRPARITGEAVRDAVERAAGAEGWSPVRVEVAILDVD